VIGSALVYAGLVAVGVGGVSLVHPLRWLGVAGRGSGAFVLALGATLVLIGFALPAPFIRIADEPMRLDDFVPVYQFAEAHETRVRAPADRVYRAIQQVSASEIRFFHLLTWIRAPHLPGRGPESILNAPGEQPLLSVALRSGFMLLVEEPGREMVVGTIVCCRPHPRGLTPEGFRALDEPGYAKAAMNFRVTDAGGVGPA